MTARCGIPNLMPMVYVRRMILLRHGQSEFNLHFGATRRDPGIPDPVLTELGHTQAETAASRLAERGLKRIIVSPYTRALQTAAPLVRHMGLAAQVNPLVRERYAFSCDIGSPRTELAMRWPDHDFSGIDEVWWPPVEEAEAALIARARLFQAEMAALPDWRDSVVVCHWGFIMGLTGQSVMNGEWISWDPTRPPPDRIDWPSY